MLAYNVTNPVSSLRHCTLGGGKNDHQFPESNLQNASKSGYCLSLLNKGKETLLSQTLEQGSPRVGSHLASNFYRLYLPFTILNLF